LDVCTGREFIPADRGPQIPLDTLRYDSQTKSIQRWSGHNWVAQRTPKTLIAETRKLIELRDAATAVIGAQRDNQPAADREQLRGHLNHLCDRYVEKHGPINRFPWVYPNPVTQGRHDKKVGAAEERWPSSCVRAYQAGGAKIGTPLLDQTQRPVAAPSYHVHQPTSA
jgi:hypothetical protein